MSPQITSHSASHTFSTSSTRSQFLHLRWLSLGVIRRITSTRTLVAAMLAFLGILLMSSELLAQGPRNFRLPPYDLPDVESSEAEADTLPEAVVAAPRRVIVDTDPGVDDATALVWLFSQQFYPVTVEGVVTVAGNTNIYSATANANLVLDWLGADVPLVQGAETPLVQPQSLTPWLIHGPDGLWFTFAPPATDVDPRDATTFYCDLDPQTLTPGMLVIALGPLTNIASAMVACPEQWVGVEIVSLGGSRATPNQTPVTEYNYWQDPEAAAIVLAHAPATTLQIVLSDAFSQFPLERSHFGQLQSVKNQATQNLLPILQAYYDVLLAGGSTPNLPDPTAAIYALDNSLATAQPAQVEILAGPGIPEIARGQTIIGLTPLEQVTMLADDAQLSGLALQAFSDPNFDLNAAIFAILSSAPPNATVVTDIDVRLMNNRFVQGLRFPPASVSSSGAAETQQNTYDNHTFVPLIVD